VVLLKCNKKGDFKMTKMQFMNEIIKMDLENILATNKKPLSIKQIADFYNDTHFDELTLQKTAALLRQLTFEGKAYRIEVNNKAYFSDEEPKLKKAPTDEPLTAYGMYVRFIKFIKKVKNSFDVPLD
jgi:hypothetical protein